MQNDLTYYSAPLAGPFRLSKYPNQLQHDVRNIIPISRLRDPDISKILSIRSNTKKPDIHQILDPTEEDVGIGKLVKSKLKYRIW